MCLLNFGETYRKETERFLFAVRQESTGDLQTDCRTVRRAGGNKGKITADTSCRFNLLWHDTILWEVPLWVNV